LVIEDDVDMPKAGPEHQDRGTQTDPLVLTDAELKALMPKYDASRLHWLLHHVGNATDEIKEMLGVTDLSLKGPLTPLPAVPTTPPNLGAAGSTFVPRPATCPMHFIPATSDKWETSWKVFAAIHEEDSYVAIDWQKEVEDQLGPLPNGSLPKWANQVLGKQALTTIRFGRPVGTGPRLFHWLPIRSFGRCVRTLVLAMNGEAADNKERIPMSELSRFCLLYRDHQAEDAFPYEVLRLPAQDDKEGAYHVYVKANQSMIRTKVLSHSGGVVNAKRPAEEAVGKQGGM
jgi:hypothetical protein